MTSENGWFVFRGLWPGDEYTVAVAARGHGSAETPQLTGKAGETQDVGKIVLIDTSGYLAGQVVGSDGKPIAGANVFNAGDAPERVATSTDSQGQFRLAGMFPGRKFAFIRKEGYRFTGIKSDDDADGLTITLLKISEPPPAWKPAQASSYDEQRAFAKQVLIRLWEKYGADPEKTGASRCVAEMAEFDPNLALEWSFQHGRRYDDVVHQTQARKLAETDPAGALAMLNQKPDEESQSILQSLAERFAEIDRERAVPFAEEAAVQAKGLIQPARALAMARAGAVLAKLGRADAGRTLIDEAARDAAQLDDRWSYYRGVVAQILAPFDLPRALALIEAVRDEATEKDRHRALIATAIATNDTSKAVALVETVGGPAFYHELARTEIAFKIGADRPDEAIKIIEGINRNRWSGEFQAAAFGWLAVALAPRDRTRAFGLIDRALAMMIDNRDAMGPDDEMAVAARIAICARRIGYPDMESVVMRVMATRFAGDSRWGRDRLIGSTSNAAVALALVDPEPVRTVLEQIEARSGLDPTNTRDVREPWLIAWALVDLKRRKRYWRPS